MKFIKYILILFNVVIFYITSAGAEIVSNNVPVSMSTIDAINIEGDGDSAQLIIKLSSHATYTSYKTVSPNKLIIDFSQISPGSIKSPLELNKGNFKSVNINKFDTDAGVLTRMEIELVKDREAVIIPSKNNLGEITVYFPASGTVAESKNDLHLKDEKNIGTAANASSDVVLGSGSNLTGSSNQTATLSDITVEGNKIFLNMVGSDFELKTFRLNKPERFVIDLVGAKSTIINRLFALNSSGISSARVGLYPDKVRVVLDAINGTFPETTASKSDRGITLNVDSNSNGSAVLLKNTSNDVITSDNKSVVLPIVKVESNDVQNVKLKDIQPVTKTFDATHTLQSIESVDFQILDGFSRVSIKTSGTVKIDPPIKSNGFITLSFANYVLPKSLQRSIETKSFSTPVLRITPFMIKTKKVNETKIRISLRTPSKFEFHQEADLVYLDFKHSEVSSAEKLVEVVSENKKSSSASDSVTQSKDTELSEELAPQVADISEPIKSAGLTNHKYRGKKVTLEFADAEVRKIFQLLSEVSNKNFVLGDDVSGTISLKLVNVPWDQALDIILDTKGLDKREDGNIVLIKGKGKFKSQSEEEQEIKKALTKAIELKTETFNINYSDTASISTQFASLKSDRGVIAQDSRTNKVIVRDIPQALDDMRKMLAQLDVPEKQVMIEARIIEATSTFTRNLGVSWGVHYRDGSAALLGINKLDTSFGGITSAPPSSGQVIPTSASGGNMGISFGTLTSNIQLDMRLSAAASAGMIKIISTPKIATLNNKTAKITQGQQIPYQNTTATTGATTQFVEAALALEVTPHINANGTVSMKIDAKNDAPGQSTGAIPPINKKQATTEMLLRDGETTVIGGIFVDSDTESDDGVPYLMDIPFIGKFFKSNTKTKTKTELLIFITPRILSAS